MGLVTTVVIANKTGTRSQRGKSSIYTLLESQNLGSFYALPANDQTEVRPYNTFYGVSIYDEQDNAIAKMPEEL